MRNLIYYQRPKLAPPEAPLEFRSGPRRPFSAASQSCSAKTRISSTWSTPPCSTTIPSTLPLLSLVQCSCDMQLLPPHSPCQGPSGLPKGPWHGYDVPCVSCVCPSLVVANIGFATMMVASVIPAEVQSCN
jgi:hypothetical protein